jgi:hypothetical protein
MVISFITQAPGASFYGGAWVARGPHSYKTSYNSPAYFFMRAEIPGQALGQFSYHCGPWAPAGFPVEMRAPGHRTNGQRATFTRALGCAPI